MPNTDKRHSIYSRSENKFEKWKRDGRGTGTGRDYKPGLKITEVPSGTENNRKHSVPGIKAKGRLVQLMSDLEFFVFISFDLAKQVLDIREQFPLDREITLAIAERLNIAHPIVTDSSTGEDIANWMTTDLLIDFVDKEGVVNQVAICIKPAEKLTPRNLQKIKIEFCYWALKGVRFCIITDRCVPEEIKKNLSFIHDFYEDDLNILEMQSALPRVEQLLMNSLKSYSGELRVMCKEIDEAHDFESGTALQVLHYMIASRKIDVDLTQLSIGLLTEATSIKKYMQI